MAKAWYQRASSSGGSSSISSGIISGDTNANSYATNTDLFTRNNHGDIKQQHRNGGIASRNSAASRRSSSGAATDMAFHTLCLCRS